MFKIKFKCFEPGRTEAYEDIPASDPFFFDRELAWKEIMRMANDEKNLLNDCNAGNGNHRYTVVADSKNQIAEVVSRWYGADGSRHSERITIYTIYETTEPNTVELYGFTTSDAEVGTRNPDIESNSQVFSSKREAECAAWTAYEKAFKFARYYGLLMPSETKMEQSQFIKKLWATPAEPLTIRRTDMCIRFSGWTQFLKIGG